MRIKEFTGKTTQEAIDNGLAELGVTIADVHVDVLQEGAKGLFGLFGSKPACVRLTVMEDEREDDHGLSDLLGSFSLNEQKKKSAPKPAAPKPAAPKPAAPKPEAPKPEAKLDAPKAEAKPEMKPEKKPEKKPEAAPVPPVEEKKPQVPVPYLLRIATNEKIYINKPEFSIGRSATKADYTVTDNSDVSRIHCIIERKNGVSYIRDNASTNGTFVNGQNIAGQKNVFLTNNAKVSLGDEGFIYFVR